MKDGSYRALPARRVFIPKPGRPQERRPLSIPTVRDRVVQAALTLVIEPVFEADFLPCTFGFRPRKSAHDALQVLIDQSREGRRWVLESDIADCFEAIEHSGSMGLQLKQTKTGIVHLEEGGEGLDLLGFHHRRARGDRGYRHLRFLARWPSREAMQRARSRIREITNSKRLRDPLEVSVHELNRFLRGWAGYFRYENSCRHFTKISTCALERLARFVARRHKRASGFGWTVIHYWSSDHMGLINLDGTVVTPSPFRDWRAKPKAGGERRR
ncbi:MAG: group II intron maturase-specific domain-containing protein [Solirubrobacteraceae bacterium]